ncbi:MAG: HEAT repeat domain-containing protein [Legionella sp.]|nr:HEAT repeat domain-containing protein [Legionella sp.]
MKKVALFILAYVISLDIQATDIIDVYGTDPIKTKDLLSRYGTEVALYSAQSFNLTKDSESKDAQHQKALETLFKHRTQLLDQIKKQYGFAFVNFDTIYYPADKKVYTTIEVVEKENTSRLRFITKETKPEAQAPKQDLVEEMIQYQSDWAKVMVSGYNKQETECPVFHCFPGFSHPSLQKRFTLFTENVGKDKEKELILQTLKQESNAERRTAAAFLMGHFKDPTKIISLLTQYVMDSDSGLRNAAMRVINETMNKAHIHEINPLPFLSLLDSPYDTDRNKALLILINAANEKKSRELIIQHGKASLISLLRLKQPNNHKDSYTLLKKISGKDLGENNYASWKQWILEKNNEKK